MWSFENYEVVDRAQDTTNYIAGMVNTLDGKRIVAMPENFPHSYCVFGSAKDRSQGFVRNMMIQCTKKGESFIVMDPVSEHSKLMSAYLIEQGYLVLKIDFVDKRCSDLWNPLQDLETEKEVGVLCSAIIQNTKGFLSSDRIDEILLNAIVLYVVNGPKEQRTLANVYDLLFDRDIHKKFSELSDTHPAHNWYNSLEEDERCEAFISLKDRLKIFDAKAVKEMMHKSDFYLASMTERKIAIFCSSSSENTMLSAMFLSLAFEKVKTNKNKPVHFILDDFTNCGIIKNFKQVIETAEFHKIRISILLNNITQLKKHYYSERMADSFGCIVYMGGKEKSTIEYVSKKGKQAQRKTYSFMERSMNPIFSLKKIIEMKDDELLLIVKEQRPVKLQKFFFHKYPKMIKNITLRSRL